MTSIVDSIRDLFAQQPVGSTLGTAFAWCAGILVMAYLLASISYRRQLS